MGEKRERAKSKNIYYCFIYHCKKCPKNAKCERELKKGDKK